MCFILKVNSHLAISTLINALSMASSLFTVPRGISNQAWGSPLLGGGGLSADSVVRPCRCHRPLTQRRRSDHPPPWVLKNISRTEAIHLGVNLKIPHLLCQSLKQALTKSQVTF